MAANMATIVGMNLCVHPRVKRHLFSKAFSYLSLFQNQLGSWAGSSVSQLHFGHSPFFNPLKVIFIFHHFFTLPRICRCFKSLFIPLYCFEASCVLLEFKSFLCFAHSLFLPDSLQRSLLQATDNKWYWNLCIIEHGHTF